MRGPSSFEDSSATSCYVELFQHGFRILFPSALPPGGEFDIAFAIRLPGELCFLSPIEEIMSIALVRWDLGVERLDFRVCLNFEPLSVAGEHVNTAGELPRSTTHPASPRTRRGVVRARARHSLVVR